MCMDMRWVVGVWVFLPYIRRRFMVSSWDKKLPESSFFEGPVLSDKWMIPWIWTGFTENQSSERILRVYENFSVSIIKVKNLLN